MKIIDEQIKTLNVMHSLLETIDGKMAMRNMGIKHTTIHLENIRLAIARLQLLKKIKEIL